MSIRILHLYPRQLGINGDVGNVTALRRRSEWRGAGATVIDFEPGTELPGDVHLVHIGSGPTREQAALRGDVARIAPALREWAADGVPFLAIAAGWQLLGETLDGEPVAGVFPSRATLTGQRVVGEVAGESRLGEVAGFVNHGAATALTGGEPLVRFRDGSSDGVVAGALVGTNLHGPFLPMNPAWADHLLGIAAARAGVELREPDPRMAAVDDAAARARAAIRARLRL